VWESGLKCTSLSRGKGRVWECTIGSQGSIASDNSRTQQNLPRNTLYRASQIESGSLNISGNIPNWHAAGTLNHNTEITVRVGLAAVSRLVLERGLFRIAAGSSAIHIKNFCDFFLSTRANAKMCDFRLPPPSKWGLRSSWILRNVDWWSVTDRLSRNVGI
jgi:hypothetical protein